MENPDIHLLPSQEPDFHDQFVEHIGRGTFKNAFDSKEVEGCILLKFREFSIGRCLKGDKVQLQPDDISKTTQEYMQYCYRSKVKLPKILAYCDIQTKEQCWLIEKVNGIFYKKLPKQEQKIVLEKVTDDQVIQLFIDFLQFTVDLGGEAMLDIYGDNIYYEPSNGFGFIDPWDKETLDKTHIKLLNNFFYSFYCLKTSLSSVIPNPKVFDKIANALKGVNKIKSILDMPNEELLAMINQLEKLQTLK